MDYVDRAGIALAFGWVFNFLMYVFIFTGDVAAWTVALVGCIAGFGVCAYYLKKDGKNI